MVHNLFPSPVYTVIADKEDFSKENAYFNAIEMTKFNNNNYGEKSTSSYVLDDYRLSNFSRWVVNNIKYFSENHYFKNTSVGNYVLLQSWISIKNKGQQTLPHGHPNSIISGVYYWEPVQQPLIFVCPRTIEFGITQVPDLTFTLDNIQPGTLVLFPSYLKHSVPVNNTDIPRKSLAFNSIPTAGLGSESMFTEINFYRLKNKLLGR